MLNLDGRFDKGYITWINDDKPAWTIYAAGMGPDLRTEIGPRLIPVEPMVRSSSLSCSFLLTEK